MSVLFESHSRLISPSRSFFQFWEVDNPATSQFFLPFPLFLLLPGDGLPRSRPDFPPLPALPFISGRRTPPLQVSFSSPSHSAFHFRETDSPTLGRIFLPFSLFLHFRETDSPAPSQFFLPFPHTLSILGDYPGRHVLKISRPATSQKKSPPKRLLFGGDLKIQIEKFKSIFD